MHRWVHLEASMKTTDQYIKEYREDMQRLAPATEEAWKNYRLRNLDKLADMGEVDRV